MNYYFAYGMNTSLTDMSRRCPGSKSLGVATLPGYELVFKFHCDVVENPDSVVHGVLWSVSDSDMKTLDILEGVPYYYQRKVVRVLHKGKLRDAIVYVMNDGELSLPSGVYLDTVYSGYIENGVDVNQLDRALQTIT